MAEERRVSPLVKVFVALHVVAITSWCLPPPPRDLAKGDRQLKIDRSSLPAFAQSLGRGMSEGTLLFNDRYLRTSPERQYLLATGFWQYWDMFSPNPSNTDLYGTATITYRNGAVRIYHYPRMYDLSIPGKYVNERYRKFYERAHQDANREYWPVFAQRIARVNYRDPDNPPVRVVLTRHFQVIAAPGEPQADYERFDYYAHEVDQEALRRN